MLKSILIILVVILIFTVVGLGIVDDFNFLRTFFPKKTSLVDQINCHNKIVYDGFEKLNIVKEINHMFGIGNVDHFIESYQSDRYIPNWNAVVLFGGRYEFTVKFPVLIDYKNCRMIRKTDELQGYLYELTEVRIQDNGIAAASTKRVVEFNEHEWNSLVKNEGDWSALNVNVQTDLPKINNFDEYVQQGRKLYEYISEGNSGLAPE